MKEPSRSTLMVSAMRASSSRWWLIKTMATPLALSSSSTAKSASTSLPVSAAVGSSKMRMRAFMDSALAISTSCCLATPSSPTGMSRSTSKPIRCSAAWACALRCLRLTNPKRRGVRPSMMFSATDMVGTRLSSWWMVAIPSASEALVSGIFTSVPSTRMRPESGSCTPAIILMRVDLPAPFSPNKACTWPRRTVRSTPLMTSTGPKDLVTLSRRNTQSLMAWLHRVGGRWTCAGCSGFLAPRLPVGAFH